METTERLDCRTGIEGWDGRPLRWRPTLPAPCVHFCPDASHPEHRWACGDPRCVRPEAAVCASHREYTTEDIHAVPIGTNMAAHRQTCRGCAAMPR